MAMWSFLSGAAVGYLYGEHKSQNPDLMDVFEDLSEDEQCRHIYDGTLLCCAAAIYALNLQDGYDNTAMMKQLSIYFPMDDEEDLELGLCKLMDEGVEAELAVERFQEVFEFERSRIRNLVRSVKSLGEDSDSKKVKQFVELIEYSLVGE